MQVYNTYLYPSCIHITQFAQETFKTAIVPMANISGLLKFSKSMSETNVSMVEVNISNTARC